MPHQASQLPYTAKNMTPLLIVLPIYFITCSAELISLTRDDNYDDMMTIKHATKK